ncbi:MAG: Na+/H+ antiporter [Flavobacteriales bacterium]|jgi:CPA1 family monovalent cation:H+ antiporter|nr:Na+/H+ antiporter [Flavobacteriales bacterium]
MLHHDLLLVIGLLFAASLLTLLGPKLRIAQPILLVLGGLAIALIPGVPHVKLEPELVFLVFLPPLLYEAAWFTSWRAFWKWKRSILMLAFGLVFFTSLVVAFFTSWLIPGFTLAMGFLLGGIISPPDAVAATSVLKGMPIPKRATAILEGESLVNDASSLIVFRFALAAVVSGQFVATEALEQFTILVLGGIVVGLVIAHAVYFLHRALPTTPSIDTAMTLMSPYIMYIAAEELECSGVISVVTGGLFLSFRSHAFLDYRARVQATQVWHTVSFVLNALVFILIGLDLPVIVEGLSAQALGEAIVYGLLVSLLVIAVRFLWMYPAAHIPRWLFPRIRRNEQSPGWRGPTLLSWAGMRGVVSLAAALSIPVALPTGEPFPHRETILVITFTVILVTLVGQGLTLPWVVRLLNMGELDADTPHAEQELALRIRMVRAVVEHVTSLPDRDQRLERVHQHFLSLEQNYLKALEELRDAEKAALPEDGNRELQRSLIAVQRRSLADARRERAFDAEVVRKMEGQLDLEEMRMNN